MNRLLILALLLAACTPANSPYDVNGDGRVDRDDSADVLSCMGLGTGADLLSRCQPADINGDGKVDIKDFNLVKAHVL
jgi:hypothetical protein